MTEVPWKYLRRADNPLRVIAGGGYLVPPLPDPPTGYEWAEGDPLEGAELEPELLPLDIRIALAFREFPLGLQVKYADEITKAAVFYQWQNLPMLGLILQQAESKLSMPEDQPVKALIDAAKVELQTQLLQLEGPA